MSRNASRYRWLSLVLGFVLFPAPAFALIITLSFESVPGSVPLTGAGTPNASLNFGSVSAFEPLNPGVNRTVGASSYTISTSVGVRVTRVVSLSPNYTLQARLQSAHPLTWQLDGVTLSTTPVTISTSQPFGSSVPHMLSFVVPYSQPAGAVTTVLEVTAIGN
ncbi:MAG TPA: hypothetical protein VH740_27990 [Vicinamibacterales bacterium]